MVQEAATYRSHKFETLDGLRGVAALTVLFWHFGLPGQERIWLGGLSVNLFFVLSGFVVAFAYEDRLASGWPLREFVVARVIRLWPLYLLGTTLGLVALVSGALATHQFWQVKRQLVLAVWSVALVPQPFDARAPAFPLNNPAWSLFMEFLVNLAFAAGGWRLSTRALTGLASVCLVGSLMPMLLAVDLPPAWSSGGIWAAVPIAFFNFFAGVILFRLWRSGHLPRIRRTPATAIMTFFIVTLFAAAHFPSASAAGLVISATAWPFLVAVAAQNEPAPRSRRVFAQLARLSYPLYATHWGWCLFASMAMAANLVSPLVALGSGASLAVWFGFVADRHYDRPVRRWLLDRVADRRLRTTHASAV